MAITHLKKIKGAGLIGIITALLLIQFNCPAQQKLKPRVLVSSDIGGTYPDDFPTSPGYKTYTEQPHLGGLQWMGDKVPTPDDINLYVNTKQIKITGAASIGTINIRSKIKPVCKQSAIVDKRNGMYEMAIRKEMNYTVNYKL